MSLFYCQKCTITGDDCGPWDSEHELFSSILLVHKNHVGFQEGEPISKTNIESEFNDVFDSVIDQMLHQLVSHEKGFTKSCLINHKPWREIENWI